MRADTNASAIDLIVELGYDPVYGARPLKRAIQRHVENPLAELILSGEFSAGDKIVATASNNKISFRRK